jgi:hypothetical protein
MKTKTKQWTNPQAGKPCAFCKQPFRDDFNIMGHRQTVFVSRDPKNGDIDCRAGRKVIYTHVICGVLDEGPDKPKPGTPIPQCGF